MNGRPVNPRRLRQDGFFVCPCCGLPTLEESWFDTCPLCWWEDDGQDDADADHRKLGPNDGPNGTISLTRARANFRAHGHMYDAGSDQAARIAPDAPRLRLLALAQSARFDTVAYRAWLEEFYAPEEDTA